MIEPLPLLYYVLDPTPFPLQASSTAALTLLVTNNNSTPVTLEGISIKIPIGSDDGGDLAITSDQIIQIAPNNQWKHNEPKLETGFVTFIFVPDPQKTYTLQARDALTFVLSNIKVNDQPGSVQITVTEGSSGSGKPPTKKLEISKFPAGWGTTSFTALPANINTGEKVTLSWSGPAGATYSIQYIDEHEKTITIPMAGQPPLNNSGVYPGPSQPSLELAHTTVFTLTVAYTDSNTKNTYHTEKQQTVTVAPAAPEITCFTAEIDHNASQSVLLLCWQTTNADHVEGSWTSELLDANPQVKTPVHGDIAATYSITAVSVNGAKSKSKDVTFTWEKLREIPVGDNVGALVFSLDGAFVFVADSAFYTNTISVIEVKTLKVIKKIEIPFDNALNVHLASMALTKDNLFVIKKNSSHMGVISIKNLTLQLLEHSHTFGAGIAVSPTLPYGIVELADGSCQQFNTDTLSFTSIMPPLSSGGTGWYYMNMLPDQTCIAVNYLDHFVWKVDIVNLKVLKTLNMQQSFDFNAIAIGPLYDAHNPNANVYAYIPTLFNIEVINCQTMQHVRAINLDPSNIVGIAISNVLPYAFVLGTDRDNNENAVVVIDLRTNTVTQKIPNGDVNAIAISPDGYSVFVVNESTVSVLRLK